MKQILITRKNGKVEFATVSVDVTETVFFTNMDTDPINGTHWPDIASNELGPYPSPNSSQCPVPPPPAGTTTVTYKCKIHPNETGTINVFPQLAAVSNPQQQPPPPPIVLPPARKGQPINPPPQVVTGGMKPYTVSDQIYQITGSSPVSGSIGPGLQLSQAADSKGVWGLYVRGTPTQSGTFNFTFTVNDAMGRNLQQVQYSITVA